MQTQIEVKSKKIADQKWEQVQQKREYLDQIQDCVPADQLKKVVENLMRQRIDLSLQTHKNKLLLIQDTCHIGLEQSLAN
jgi:hypothetical protein